MGTAAALPIVLEAPKLAPLVLRLLRMPTHVCALTRLTCDVTMSPPTSVPDWPDHVRIPGLRAPAGCYSGRM